MGYHFTYKAMIVFCVTAMSGINLHASAEESISERDVQKLEESFENYSQKLISTINPKLKFSVVANVELSQHPSLIAKYEEQKMLNHLPGLPEISDPHFDYPTESPLYSLINKKNIQVFFHGYANESDTTVITRVLKNKLKLSPSDSLTFESASSQTSTPKRMSRIWMVVGVLFGAALIWAGTRKKPLFKKPKNTIPPPLANSVINNQILSTPRLVLKNALLMENVALIAKSTLHTSEKLKNHILSEMNQNKFDRVHQWTQTNASKISKEEAEYARLLLAARVHQVQNQSVLKSIERFNEARAMRVKLMSARKPVQSRENSQGESNEI